MDRHEIPTHLGVEDHVFAGLTMQQLIAICVGLALAYSAGNDLPLPSPLRMALAGLTVALALLFVLCRPEGRSVIDWGFVLLRYCAIPRIAVWRPEPTAASPTRQPACLEVALPPISWAYAPTVSDSSARRRRKSS